MAGLKRGDVSPFTPIDNDGELRRFDGIAAKAVQVGSASIGRTRVVKECEPGSLYSRDCLRSRTVGGVCDVCQSRPDVLHMPLKLHGWFCGEHCPCCHGGNGNHDTPGRAVARQ